MCECVLNDYSHVVLNDYFFFSFQATLSLAIYKDGRASLFAAENMVYPDVQMLADELALEPLAVVRDEGVRVAPAPLRQSHVLHLGKGVSEGGEWEHRGHRVRQNGARVSVE